MQVTITVIVFLFILYCILETSKYSRLDYEYVKEGKERKLRKKHYLNPPIVHIKLVVYMLMYLVVIINHFTDPLTRSGGIRGFIITLMGMTFFMVICIIDEIKVRKYYDKG